MNERENLPENPQTEHEEKIVKSYSLATLKLDDVCDSIQTIDDFNSHNLNIAIIDLVQRLKCFQPKIQDKIILLNVSFFLEKNFKKKLPLLKPFFRIDITNYAQRIWLKANHVPKVTFVKFILQCNSL